MFKHSTPISGDYLTYYTKSELYDFYIEEGRSHTEALALSQELCKSICALNQKERRMWQRSLREKGLWEPKPKKVKGG